MALVEDPERQVHFLGPLVCTPSKHIPNDWGQAPRFFTLRGKQYPTPIIRRCAGKPDEFR